MWGAQDRCLVAVTFGSSSQYRSHFRHCSDGVFHSETHNATLRQTLDGLNQSHERSASMMLDLEHMDDESLECLRDIYEGVAVRKVDDKERT